MQYKLYNVLGLNKGSNPDQNEIKRAYKKLAMEYHPDKNKDNPKAEERFKEISSAYAVLSDENKKRIYDQTGDENFAERESGGGGHPFGGQRMNHSDIFEHFFRGGHNPFASHFGFEFDEFGQGGGREPQCPSVHKTLSISLEEAFEGVSKNMKIEVTKYCHSCMKRCTNCNGSGIVKQIKHMGILTQVFQGKCDQCSGLGYMIDAKASCKECKGCGKYTKEVNAHLSLPKGINSGFKTAFPEMGEQPKQPNQKAGDLILEVSIQEHKHFRRVGNDLYYKCDLPYVQSVVGKDIEIPYFKETIKLNTSIFGVAYPGKSYLIEGKGMPIPDTNNKGNMFIEFNITFPKIKNKDKLEELEKLLKETFAL